MINFYNPNVRSKRTYEDVSAYTDAIKMIGLIMAAARKAEALGLDRVAHALHGNAALAAGNTTAAGLTDYGNMIGQFMDRAKQYGCFDRVADAAMPVADFAGEASSSPASALVRLLRALPSH